MSVNTSGQYTIYTLPRKFRADAKLHPFLAMKTPDMIKANKVEYTLFTVSIICFAIYFSSIMGFIWDI